LVPPGGGYVEPQTAVIFDNGTGATNRANDYTRPTDWATSANPAGGDQKWATLYYNNQLVCEYINATTADPNTGNEPCNIAGSCGATPTPTATMTSTATPTATPSITPAMPLLKTVNVSAAILGDTVTFCINWTNDSTSVRTFNVWDSISTYISYLGCISGCAKTGQVVSWTVTSANPGDTGTFCFWGTLNGFPWLPGGEAPGAAPKRRETLLALYFPLEGAP
jgi:hypothetical protein